MFLRAAVVRSHLVTMDHWNPPGLKAALGVLVCCVLYQCYQQYGHCHGYLSGVADMPGVLEVLAPLLLLPHLSSAAPEECLPAKVYFREE